MCKRLMSNLKLSVALLLAHGPIILSLLARGPTIISLLAHGLEYLQSWPMGLQYLHSWPMGLQYLHSWPMDLQYLHPWPMGLQSLHPALCVRENTPRTCLQWRSQRWCFVNPEFVTLLPPPPLHHINNSAFLKRKCWQTERMRKKNRFSFRGPFPPPLLLPVATVATPLPILMHTLKTFIYDAVQYINSALGTKNKTGNWG